MMLCWRAFKEGRRSLLNDRDVTFGYGIDTVTVGTVRDHTDVAR
jgi:hypothetical protein